MYVSPGTPFFRTGYYEREQLRRTASGVSWTALVGIFLMSIVFPGLGELFLYAVNFRFSADTSFSGLPPVLYYLMLLYMNSKMGMQRPYWMGSSFRMVSPLKVL